ncbi:amidohydrolase family protein [Nocardia sp. NPDC052316]|uniref:amidohydrolase family protein n=1 Tax=Nocardia sp. NPDC052316 TaxID=3364329 RepID=UPI0037C626E1
MIIENSRIAGITLGTYTPEPDVNVTIAADAHVMDLTGYHVMPGVVDTHAHFGTLSQAPDQSYVNKLWLGHGVTTVREVGCMGNGLELVSSEAQRSAQDRITAPRIVPYVRFGQGGEGVINGKQAAAWVSWVAGQGAKGVKFFGAAPEQFKAALAECNRLGLGSACHHSPQYMPRVNALISARWGLRSVEHHYGLAEAMLTGSTVQRYEPDYNYMDEPDRFLNAGAVWLQSVEPGSQVWENVLNEFLSLGTTLSPTFNIYIAARDAARARTYEWHEDYTAPQLWDFYSPNPKSHGSFQNDWTTSKEAIWRHAYQRWMAFVNDYKNKGGRVTAGSDSGFIYSTYGFGIIQELELLQEAGFDPLEVVKAATLNGAELLDLADELGTLAPGKLADIIVVKENPLANFKVLYGSGHLRMTSDGMQRTQGVVYTIKNGIVYDAGKLREDVKEQVVQEWKQQGRYDQRPRTTRP